MEPRDPAIEPVTRFDLVNDIVEAAAELPPEQREAFVAQHCERDTTLRHSVLRLLSAFEKMGDFLCAPPLRAPEVRPGDVLAGRFRVVEKLGEGGMGCVYLAEDRELGEVALKTVRAELRGDGEAIERFRSEIRLSRGVGHRNVCPVFELFPNEQTAAGPVTFFTMKYLKGETLARRLARGPMEFADALRLARGIAAGLDALHGDGIVHRDLKPGNIILTPEQDGTERPVITDFGLARTSGGTGADSSRTGAAQILGSPDYMAPEQFLSAAVTKAADIYAFGLIVYEMVTGARPFPKEDMLRAAVRRVTEDAPALRSVVKGVPAKLERGVARALAREPEQRAGSAGEVVRGGADDFGAKRVSRRAVLAAAGGAVFLSGVYGIGRYRKQDAPLPESPKLMLTACAHLPGDKDREIAATVDTLLRTQLQQSAHLSLLDSASVDRALARMRAGSGQTRTLDDARTVREVALREGASYVLFGDLGRKADVYNVGLRLELLGPSPERERQHWDFDAPVREDELPEMPSRIDRAVYELRRKLGESQKDWEVHNRTPAELTTGSWGALQLYVRGNEAWKTGKQQQAIDLLRAATAIDGNFAAAHGKLGDYLMALGEVDAAFQSHEHAAKLVESQSLTDPESLQILGMYALDTRQNEKAASIYRRFRTEYPLNAFPYFYEATAEFSVGHHEASTKLLRDAVNLAPRNYAFVATLAINLLADGDFEAADNVIRQAAELGHDPWTPRIRAALAFSRSRGHEVQAQLDIMRAGDASENIVGTTLEACFRAEQGRLAEAEQLLREAIASIRSNGLGPAAELDNRIQLAEIYRQQGRRTEAIGLCLQMLSDSKSIQERMRIGGLLARNGATHSAVSCLADCPGLPVYQHWLFRLRGEIALAAGNAAEGFSWMRRVPPITRNVWPDYLFRAAIAATETAVARRQASDLFDNPGRFWLEADTTPAGFIREAVAQAHRGPELISTKKNFLALDSMLGS